MLQPLIAIILAGAASIFSAKSRRYKGVPAMPIAHSPMVCSMPRLRCTAEMNRIFHMNGEELEPVFPEKLVGLGRLLTQFRLANGHP